MAQAQEQTQALSDDQLDSWKTNGFLILDDVFSPSETEQFRQEANFILQLIINSSLCHQRQSRRLDIRSQQDGRLIVRKIQPINDLSLVLSKASADPRVLDPMRFLMGDEPILMEEKLNYKQPVRSMSLFQVPQDDDRFPIHNDWAYYKMNGYPDSIISTAIAFDECGEEQGPIQVFPGTHIDHVEHDRVRNGLEVPEGTVERSNAVPLRLKPGSVCYFHAKLIHTSQPNVTEFPRRIMIFSHYPKYANMGIDVRNGPNRLRESPWEWEYQRKKATGAFVDPFVLDSAA